MKIRTSHVTNSSSTSYIVGLKKAVPSSFASEEEMVTRGWNNEDYGYKEMVELIEKGYHVVQISVDNIMADIDEIINKLVPDAVVEMLPI